MFQSEYELLDGSLFENNDIFSSTQMQSQNYELFNFNKINGLLEDVKLNNSSQISSLNFIQSRFEKCIVSKSTKSTTIKNNQKENQCVEPELCTLKDILKIFNEKSNRNKINEPFKKKYRR